MVGDQNQKENTNPNGKQHYNASPDSDINDQPNIKKLRPNPNSGNTDSSMNTGQNRKTDTGSGAGGPRKLVIKPFKSKPTPPAAFEEKTFAKLAEAVEAVYSKRAIDVSQEELYRSVESLCMHKKFVELFDALRKQVTSHTERTVRALAQSAAIVVDTSQFLSGVESAWNEMCEQLLTIRGIFLYLDRTYVIHQPDVRSIWDMGLAVFKDNLKSGGNADLERKLVSSLLQLIERERQGENVNRHVLKNLLRMLIALRVYRQSFEAPFMKATESFYETEAQRLINELNVPDYLAHVSKRLNEENDRVVHYLDEVTRRPLIIELEQQLIGRHTATLISKGFDKLMGGGSVAAAPLKHELAAMYTLFSRVEALDPLRDAFGKYIQTTGSALVADTAKDPELVKLLLAFKSGLDEVLHFSFGDNPEFAHALKTAFEAFINERANKPAELIAKFVDKKLRAGAGSAGSTEDELEAVLNKVMTLFRYINGKDVFQAFYREDLAKRLLLGKSASVDSEKLMIEKIKAECGGAFTSKLEGMFQDIELSKELASNFEADLKEKESKGVVTNKPVTEPEFFRAQVLTSGAWPDYKAVAIPLPPEVKWYQEAFSQMYITKYNGRRLEWQNSLATVELRANFPKGRRMLIVSGFQAAVLLAFNEADSLSFKQLLAATNLDEKELRRNLQSLALPEDVKVRVLNKEPKTKTIGDSDVFSYNADFKHNLLRVTINQVQLKETKEEQKITTEKVFIERQFAIDAALIRVMKARKSLLHNQLIAEATSQLKFPVAIADIKKRITVLIDKEYIERDKDNSQMYNYQA